MFNLEEAKKVRVIEIDSCGACSHFGTDKNVKPACKLLDLHKFGRKVPADGSIPKWCPLPTGAAYLASKGVCVEVEEGLLPPLMRHQGPHAEFLDKDGLRRVKASGYRKVIPLSELMKEQEK